MGRRGSPHISVRPRGVDASQRHRQVNVVPPCGATSSGGELLVQSEDRDEAAYGAAVTLDLELACHNRLLERPAAVGNIQERRLLAGHAHVRCLSAADRKSTR